MRSLYMTCFFLGGKAWLGDNWSFFCVVIMYNMFFAFFLLVMMSLPD